MGDDDPPVDSLGDDGDEDDEFHDADGSPVLGDADPFEVSVYAHHCWRIGVDADALAAALGRA